MKQLFEKLLKTPAGKYSRKSFMIIVSFAITMLVGMWIVVGDALFKKQITNISIEVFNSLLIFVATLTGLSIGDKKFESKNQSTDAPRDE